jgi:hypothetical protein
MKERTLFTFPKHTSHCELEICIVSSLQVKLYIPVKTGDLVFFATGAVTHQSVDWDIVLVTVVVTHPDGLVLLSSGYC